MPYFRAHFKHSTGSQSVVDKYFSQNPVFLVSKEIVKTDQINYAYYALKITEYKLSYDIKKTFASYNAFIEVSCNIWDNSRSGDLIETVLNQNTSAEVKFNKVYGFSTTTMALTNTKFSPSDINSLTIIAKYSYQDDNWTLSDLTVGGISQPLIRDLESFPQNIEFREVIGISTKP